MEAAGSIARLLPGLQPTAAPPAAMQRTARPDQAHEAAVEFEAFFIGQIASLMFSGLGGDGYIDAGPGEAIYRSMMGEEFGRAAARAGGIGISGALQREILKLQEAATP